ncbi:MAG: hypothetical protein JWM57_1790 [Phycisphaerales bacterium]|nr:hypothetical protein [Phycisphaerales bacterium]
MATSTNQPTPAKTAVGLTGAAGGAVLGMYCGANLIVPAIGIAVLLAVFNKSSFKPAFRGAISVTAGHVLWFVLAAAMLNIWGDVLLDIILLVAAIIWLLVRPGLLAAIFLGLIEGVSLIVNFNSLVSAPIGSAANKALIVHCALRIGVLVLLVYEYRRFQKSKGEATSSEADALNGLSPEVDVPSL